MTTLTTYRGVAEKDGRTIHLRQADALPAGADVVVVVAQPLSSLEEQARRLEALSPEEWQAVRGARSRLRPGAGRGGYCGHYGRRTSCAGPSGAARERVGAGKRVASRINVTERLFVASRIMLPRGHSLHHE